MPFATWDVHLLLLKSYVNPTIVIFSFFETFPLLSKKDNSMTGFTEEANNEDATGLLLSVPYNPNSHVPRGGRKPRRSPLHCLGEQAKAFLDQVSFSSFLKRRIISK